MLIVELISIRPTSVCPSKKDFWHTICIYLVAMKTIKKEN